MGRNKLGREEKDTNIAEETNEQRLGNITEYDACRELQAV